MYFLFNNLTHKKFASEYIILKSLYLYCLIDLHNNKLQKSINQIMLYFVVLTTS